MSERDPSQTQASGAAPGAAEDPTALIASRPAQNARQVDSASDVDTDWRGADEAADFLGLDQELRGMEASPTGAISDPAQYEHAQAEATAPRSAIDPATPDPANSWLMTLDGEPAAAESLEPAPTSDPESDPLLLDDMSSVEEPRTRGAGWYAVRGIAALAIAGLGMALYTMNTTPDVDVPVSTATRAPARSSTPAGGDVATSRGEDLGQRTPIDDEMASTSSEDLDAIGAQTQRLGDADLTGAQLAAATDSTDALSSPLLPSPEFEQWMRDNSRSIWPGRDALQALGEQGPSGPGSTLFDPLHRLESIAALRDAIAAADRGSTAPADSDALADASSSDAEQSPPVRFNDNVQDVVTSTQSKSRLRRATASDLAGIWEGSTVPIESIDASTRMLTPAVGRVRTILYGGEIFEGRLYAVGQGKVWLDTELGRLALVSDQVQKVEQLASPDGTPVLGQAGSQVLAGLPRVRVRTPGGMFYGKVTSRDGNTVTLITDDGARITLETPVIESVPASRTVIVGAAPKP